MTLAKDSGESEIGGFPGPGAVPGIKNPRSGVRNGDWQLLLLDLNQQPFD